MNNLFCPIGPPILFKELYLKTAGFRIHYLFLLSRFACFLSFIVLFDFFFSSFFASIDFPILLASFVRLAYQLSNIAGLHRKCYRGKKLNRF